MLSLHLNRYPRQKEPITFIDFKLIYLFSFNFYILSPINTYNIVTDVGFGFLFVVSAVGSARAHPPSTNHKQEPKTNISHNVGFGFLFVACYLLFSYAIYLIFITQLPKHELCVELTCITSVLLSSSLLLPFQTPVHRLSIYSFLSFLLLRTLTDDKKYLSL